MFYMIFKEKEYLSSEKKNSSRNIPIICPSTGTSANI